MRDAAIGVFDSGVGGLTVVRALRALLPNETILYLGDTARVPYGTKSPSMVKRYALEALGFLEVAAQELWERRSQSTAQSNPLSSNTIRLKLVVVACNTVSAVALSLLRQRASVPVIGVIRSAVWQALQLNDKQKIAVIGTEGTIRSGAYQKAIETEAPSVELVARPCNLLAPLVEEGWLNHPVTQLTLKTYIGDLPNLSVRALILGCTHYPLLTEAIHSLFEGKIALVDPSISTAEEVSLLLQKRGWLASNEKEGELLCFATDAPHRFRRIASRFLGEEVKHVEQVELIQYVSGEKGSKDHDHWL